ncbi:SAM-dependent methyltransferase [Candidatus Omnitrophota bacterium]
MAKLKTNGKIVEGSFRDPSGFLFYRDGSLYRQVNISYRQDYDHLIDSGLYGRLVDSGLLVPHDEADIEPDDPSKAYKVIKPQGLPFISYPYEWSFSQLKDAALATLEIQKRSLDIGMTLKDCSSYNIQFRKGRPVLIDTFSFERYVEGSPWVAYRQFCQHFLAPLALMSYKDIRLSQLLRIYIDGVPLDLASLLLPIRTRLRFSLLSHIHLHAKSQKHFADKAPDLSRCRMSRLSFLGLIDSLESAVRGLRIPRQPTEWGDYYGHTNYSQDALQHKKDIVSEFLERTKPGMVWDLGANAGLFSRLAGDKGMQTISFDIDPLAVEKNYLDCVKNAETNILPLLLDVTNPSPGIGWANEERASILKRGPADTVLALALIHHLAISNNLPLNRIAKFFSKICKNLIIEFIPKSDSQVQRLLLTREDIFSGYTREDFERAFEKYFTIQDSVNIKDSQRAVYLMQGK